MRKFNSFKEKATFKRPVYQKSESSPVIGSGSLYADSCLTFDSFKQILRTSGLGNIAKSSNISEKFQHFERIRRRQFGGSRFLHKPSYLLLEHTFHRFFVDENLSSLSNYDSIFDQLSRTLQKRYSRKHWLHIGSGKKPKISSSTRNMSSKLFVKRESTILPPKLCVSKAVKVTQTLEVPPQNIFDASEYTQLRIEKTKIEDELLALSLKDSENRKKIKFLELQVENKQGIIETLEKSKNLNSDRMKKIGEENARLRLKIQIQNELQLGRTQALDSQSIHKSTCQGKSDNLVYPKSFELLREEISSLRRESLERQKEILRVSEEKKDLISGLTKSREYFKRRLAINNNWYALLMDILDVLCSNMEIGKKRITCYDMITSRCPKIFNVQLLVILVPYSTSLMLYKDGCRKQIVCDNGWGSIGIEAINREKMYGTEPDMCKIKSLLDSDKDFLDKNYRWVVKLVNCARGKTKAVLVTVSRTVEDNKIAMGSYDDQANLNRLIHKVVLFKTLSN